MPSPPEFLPCADPHDEGLGMLLVCWGAEEIRTMALSQLRPGNPPLSPRCGEVTSEYAKTFFLGTQLMTPEQAKAIWAIYVWCR